MLKLKIKYFIAFVLIFPFVIHNVNAQTEEVKQRRQIEHQAIKDLLQNKLMNSPVSNNQNQNSKPEFSLSNYLRKTNADEDRKSFFMNGNNVSVEIENYGGIAPGLGGIREITNLIWRDAPYIFQFCPIVGASVIDTSGKRIHIITDGMNDYENPNGLREIDPATGLKWQWQPLPGYADPNQDFIASNPTFDADRDGKPDSWPREWYNETFGDYVWPGYLIQGENNADLEAYWAMDDRDNKEFNYFPFPNDFSRKGIGVQIDGRAFQWSNALASNVIFFVWNITNVSNNHLDSLLFGIYGDPDLGGGGNENKDDNGLFIAPYDSTVPFYSRNMVYFWDPDMSAGTKTLGYLGCKFLESPGNDSDFVDNDSDGIIDESQSDGIDNDNDWNFETDDVGVDGIAGTGDFGEGDGFPTSGQRLSDGRPNPLSPGEPNFEYTDLDEADQIGLTSFQSSSWGVDLLMAEDEMIWNACEPGNFSEITSNEDIVFIFGSGYTSLKPGETKKISMAFLFGQDLDDLLITAETVQEIYNKNYKFFKPPSLPKVAAIPDDKKVTLYWDTQSEKSIDPITGEDFEGYVIYRSTRPDFADIQTITDGKGAQFLYEPLKDIDGSEAKWDLNNDWLGYHPVDYVGRGISYYVGDNSGLVHSFVDSNDVRNGQTYYYAVVAYDHGDSVDFPVSETTKKIALDPITNQITLSDNTVQVIPGPRASGYIRPSIKQTNFLHPSGIGNGEIDFIILDDNRIQEEIYTMTFSDTIHLIDTSYRAFNYSILGEGLKEESIQFFGTKNTKLGNTNILNDQFLVLRDQNGTPYQNEIDFEIDYQKGTIKRTPNSNLVEQVIYKLTYRNYSIYQSNALNSEDTNPVFDGILVKVSNHTQLDYDIDKSNWSSEIDYPFNLYLRNGGNPKKEAADYIVSFSDQNISFAKKFITGVGMIDIPVKYKVENVISGIPVEVMTNLQEPAGTNDSAWTPGEEIVFYKTGSPGGTGQPLSWSLVISTSPDSNALLPGVNDKLFLYTKRPFDTTDVFTLTTKAGFVDIASAKNSLDNIYVVPNPYVGSNEIEPANKLSGQNRGERRIYFENLPTKCTIRIYTLSGELVTTLDHETGFDNGREFWNLLNDDGFSVAYGVYLAHIDAPGVGEKLIKFALIK